ncbi:hypothetical protein [Ornithinimicrobium flavum]|uniref:hypothetical protein n=1 Tax=Ornithinimicrobium flavum TaxID=1288636 RepID=UPI0013052B92|nr:hypothetical protein [Ornithinimicrobium flavum]
MHTGQVRPTDAEAVALAALRYPDLPVAELDGPARQVKLLSDYRRDLVMQRSRACCQLRWHLHELDPDLALPSRSLPQANTRTRVQDFLDTQEGIVVRLARKLLVRIADLSQEIKDIEKELKTLVHPRRRPSCRCPAAACCPQPSSSERQPACTGSGTRMYRPGSDGGSHHTEG